MLFPLPVLTTVYILTAAGLVLFAAGLCLRQTDKEYYRKVLTLSIALLAIATALMAFFLFSFK